MKQFLTVCMFLFAGTAMMAQSGSATPAQPASATPASPVKFVHTEFNFGTIEYGANGTHTFTFTNISKSPVVIKNVTASCGCTTPSYTQEPIMPGKQGEVTAKYDTTRPGPFTKTLSVVINDETLILTIRGEVKPKPAQQN